MPRRTNTLPTFLGIGFTSAVFIFLVAYALLLFMGGMLSYIAHPTPSRFGVVYGIGAAGTFLVLGRCILAELAWGLPVATMASGLNVLLLCGLGAIEWAVSSSSDSTHHSAALVYAILAGVALLASLALGFFWMARTRRLRQT